MDKIRKTNNRHYLTTLLLFFSFLLIIKGESLEAQEVKLYRAPASIEGLNHRSLKGRRAGQAAELRRASLSGLFRLGTPD